VANEVIAPGEAWTIDADAVLENLEVGLFVLDRDWRLVHLNHRAEQLWQRDRVDLLGRSILAAFPRIVGTALHQALELAFASGQRRRIETVSPFREVPVAFDIIASPPGLLVLFRDLTAWRELESALRDRDELLTLAEQSAGIGVWDYDLATKMVRATPLFFQLRGMAPVDHPVPMEALRQAYHPDDRERIRELFRDGIARGVNVLEGEFRVLRPDGTVRWLFGRGRVIRDAAGNVVRFTGVDVDVTDRKASEAAMGESEVLFRRVFEQSPLGKATADLEFRLREVNPALCRMLGYSAEELAGRSLLDLVHPEDRPPCVVAARGLVNGELPQIQMEARFLRKSGEAFWVSVTVGPVRDPSGKLLYSLGIVEDIDERKRIVQALADSERRLRDLNERLEEQAELRARQLATSRAQMQAFFDNSPDWLTLQRVHPDGTILYADLNPACEAAYGLTRAQVIGRSVEQVLGVEAAQVPMRNFRECLRTGAPQRYVAQRTMAGRIRSIDVVFALVPGRDEDGARYIITTARDVTEREQLEAQLRHAQKMEAIGQLTGGVAHDFNNLLAVVMGNAELAKRQAGASIPRLMDNILRAGERGVTLTRQLLSFSRGGSGTTQVFDLAVEMPRIGEMLRTSMRRDIELRIDVAAPVWPIEADLGEFEIALLNIAVNARDAMPDGGLFSIDVRNAEPGDRTLQENEHVVIRLRDTGTGIPADVLAKVYDPFFTTKAAGVGTGLGLSQVYGFVRQAGGTVLIESAPGHGTTVIIRLPRTGKMLPAPDSGRNNLANAAGEGRILLVEDNPDVASVTAEMLRAMGFVVEVVDRASKALDRLAVGGGPVDMLLTDVVMPDGMNGLELARAVRARRPELPIVLMSGYNDAVPPGGGGFRVLRKPVPGTELRDVIFASLAAAAGVTRPG
jgi:PAS domain S-box-containing protein